MYWRQYTAKYFGTNDSREPCLQTHQEATLVCKSWNTRGSRFIAPKEDKSIFYLWGLVFVVLLACHSETCESHRQARVICSWLLLPKLQWIQARCGILAVGLSGPLVSLEDYGIWRSTLSIAKLSPVRSNIFACECGIWNRRNGQVLSQPAIAERQPHFRNGVDAGRLAASSNEVPVLNKSSSLNILLPTRLGVWREASQRVLRRTRLIYHVPQPSSFSFFFFAFFITIIFLGPVPLSPPAPSPLHVDPHGVFFFSEIQEQVLTSGLHKCLETKALGKASPSCFELRLLQEDNNSLISSEKRRRKQTVISCPWLWISLFSVISDTRIYLVLALILKTEINRHYIYIHTHRFSSYFREDTACFH